MLGFARWIATRLATYWDAIFSILTWLIPIIGGVVTGWAASVVDFFPRYSPFSWVAAGLLGALVVALMILTISFAKHQFAKAAAITRWSKEVDQINPLDSEFRRRRIKFVDIAHPISRTIEAKKFFDCELMGPCTILMVGSQLLNCRFANCDLVLVREDAVSHAVIPLVNVQIIGGVIWNATIFIPPAELQQFKEIAGVRFVTPTET